MMKKKFFAVALATTMAVSTIMTATAAAPETITGTAWWEGMQVGQDYTLTGDGSLSLDVAFESGDADSGYGAFNVELYADAWYLTTGSDLNAWWAGGATDGGSAISGVSTVFNSSIIAGTTYKITVTRSGNELTVTYANPDGSTYVEYSGTNTNIPDTLKVHVIAQIGTYTISESAEDPADDSTVEEPSTGEDGATVETPSASDTKKDDTTTPSVSEATTKNPSASTDDSVVSPSPKPDDSVVSPSPKPGDSVVSPSPTPGTVTPTGSTVTPGTTTPTGSTYVPATTVDDKQDSVSNVKSEERENVEKNAKIEGLEAAGLPADTQLRVSNILKTDASYTSAVSFLGKSYLNKDYVLVDLTLNSPTEGAKSGQLKSKIKVTLPVFKALEKASKVDIYRYDSETNTYVKVDSSAVTDGNITFETDHFTPYLFVEANAETPSGNNDATTAAKATNTTNTDKSNSPKTGDSTTAAVFGFTAMASVAAILASKKKFAK